MANFYKFIYGVVTILLAGGFIFFQHNKTTRVEDLSCTSTFRKNSFLPDESAAVVDISAYLFMGNDEKGFVEFKGKVSNKNTDYRMNRIINFSYSHQQNSALYSFTWLGMDRASDDNLPENLSGVVLPHQKKNAYRFKRLEGNTMMIEHNGTPQFACVVNKQ